MQIKFFIKIEDFEVESALYRDPDISATLPRVLRGSTNENGAQRSPSGCVCLRYLTVIHCCHDTAVVAYGSCTRRVHLLAGALRCERDMTEATSKYPVLCQVSDCIATHQTLKPGNPRNRQLRIVETSEPPFPSITAYVYLSCRYAFPPYLVMERGISLTEWLVTPRSGPAILNMFFDVARQLVRLHRAGHVHRDLKPGAHLFAPAARHCSRSQACSAAAMCDLCKAAKHMHRPADTRGPVETSMACQYSVAVSEVPIESPKCKLQAVNDARCSQFC